MATKVCGPVSVSTCNHHGYFDATGAEMVRALSPRVWVLQSWHASHPALSVLANLYSQTLYPGERDVFCLSLNPATALATSRFSDSFKSSQGHVLVRVEPGGARYSVLVLDDGDETDRVKAIFGPYAGLNPLLEMRVLAATRLFHRICGCDAISRYRLKYAYK